MCGIVGIVGNKNCPTFCYESLRKLEYRGYDSAGMAGLVKKNINIYKEEGKVENIKDFAYNLKSCFCIAHTRWATHGRPTKQNAHPQVSSDGNMAIVHNGIIDNYKQIKKQLQDEGVKFVSETDTECVIQLIAKERGTLLQRVKNATQKLTGSYAFGVLSNLEDVLVATRKNSPLYVASTTKGKMLSSDIICFADVAKSYYELKEGEFAVLSKNKIKIYSNDLKPIKPIYTQLQNCNLDITLNGYPYYMEKEINEIPGVVKKIIVAYKEKNNKKLVEALNMFRGVNDIILIGCGTAYHAGMFGAKLLSKITGINCSAHVASEFKYSDYKTNKNTLAIFISQSGETADTIGCAAVCKNSGAKTLAITNVEHSMLAKMCDEYLLVYAGAEIGVASTKAYIAQLLVLYILSRYLSDKDYDFADIDDLSKKIFKVMNIDNQIVNLLTNNSKMFFIGRGFDYITSLESALKLKEITYKSAEGYSAGELKHGYIALIEDLTPVIVFATDNAVLSKTLGNAEEVKSRGAKIIMVSPQNSVVHDYDYKIELPISQNELYAILAIVPFQMIAYKVSVKLGYNPDKPRNLAKSVTVE